MTATDLPILPTSREQLRAAVFLIALREDKVLLLRRFNTGWEDGNFSLISGHVELFEPPTAAAVREAREEAGLEVKVEDLRLVQMVHRRCHESLVYIDYFFELKLRSDEVRNCEPDKCSELTWASRESLPHNTIQYVRDIVARVRNGSPIFCEYNWR